jgi:hypothetical protein
VVGSSMSKSPGRPTRLAPKSNRRRIPPEYVYTSRSAASTNPNRSSTSPERARACARRKPYRRPTSSKFSRPVNVSSTAADWPAKPISERTRCASRTTFTPPTNALPPSGTNNVAKTRTNVVFPAPFLPSNPSTVPASISRSTPPSARIDPYDFTTPSTTTPTPRPAFRGAWSFSAGGAEPGRAPDGSAPGTLAASECSAADERERTPNMRQASGRPGHTRAVPTNSLRLTQAEPRRPKREPCAKCRGSVAA